MGAYQDAILAEHPTTAVIHLPLSETIPGVVTDLGNTAQTFTHAHEDATGSHTTIVQDETACAHYNAVGSTHGELGYTTNLRSVRIWCRPEAAYEKIISFGIAADVYSTVDVYLDGGVIKVGAINSVYSGTTPVAIDEKIFIFIQISNGRFHLYVNGAPDFSSDIFFSDMPSDYEFDWYRISAVGTKDTLVDPLINPLLDQLGNHLVTEASIEYLIDENSYILEDEASNPIF